MTFLEHGSGALSLVPMPCHTEEQEERSWKVLGKISICWGVSSPSSSASKRYLVKSRADIPQLDRGFPSFGINPGKYFKLLVWSLHSGCGEQKPQNMLKVSPCKSWMESLVWGLSASCKVILRWFSCL